MSHDWLEGNSTIPLVILEEVIAFDDNLSKENILRKVSFADSFCGQKLCNGEPKSKKINIPDVNTEEFAEFYGILLGDGCLFSDLKVVSVTADQILDEDYLKNYIKKLIYDLFGLYPHYYPSRQSRALYCKLYSKNAVKYLASLGFPIGFKKDLVIPKFISDNKENLAACIRGLMDTDGSLSAHPNSKIMIYLSITSKSLRDDVSNGLNQLGVNHGRFNKGIMLYGKNAIKFHEVIGFSNLKNIIKYEKFLETGKVPKSKEVEIFIRDRK